MARLKKGIKFEIPGQKMKGTFGDRCLEVLRHNGDRAVVYFLDGSELRGVIKGWGQYSLLVGADEGDRLVQKHSIKMIGRE